MTGLAVAGSGMPSPGPPTFGPADASLSIATQHLRQHFPDEVAAFLNREYVCWIGSAISFSCFPGLQDLLKELLELLYGKADFSNPFCPWRTCLRDVLQASNVSLDATREASLPSLWPDLNAVTSGLAARYSDVLDNSVNDGGTLRSLPWDVMELQKRYADGRVQPDAEHRLIAVLIAEGVLGDLVTTNWDGLIEQAHREVCDGRAEHLAVVVETNDIDGSLDGGSRLIKVHGCACRCVTDPSKQVLMVATRREIQVWQTSAERNGLRELVRTLLRQSPALFVGLSGQDWNLQVEILLALSNRSASRASISRLLFAEGELKQPQRTLLSHVLGDEVYALNRAAVEQKATLHLFSKPLLGALYVLMLRRKADVIIEAGRDELTTKWEPFIRRAIASLEQTTCARFDAMAVPTDPSALWRALVSEVPSFVSRFVRLFNAYKIPLTDHGYYPLLPDSVKDLERNLQMQVQPALAWLMMVIAALYEGARSGTWSIIPTTSLDGTHGQFEIEIARRRISIFVVPDSGTGSGKLSNNRFIDPVSGKRAAVIYATGRRLPPPGHTPRRSLPHSAVVVPAEIWMQDLAHLHSDELTLVEGLKYEFLIA